MLSVEDFIIIFHISDEIIMKYSSRIFASLISILFCLALSACNEPRTPNEAATFFWTAMQHRDAPSAQKLSMDGSAAALLDQLKPQTFSLGPVESSGNQASIPTKLSQMDGLNEKEILLTTVLYYQNEKWRVSIAQTEDSLLPGAFRKLWRNLEDAGKEISNQLGADLKEAAEESLPAIENNIKQNFNQMQKELNNLLNPQKPTSIQADKPNNAAEL